MQADIPYRKKEIEEFKRLYKKIYQVELSDEEATRRATIFSPYILQYMAQIKNKNNEQ